MGRLPFDPDKMARRAVSGETPLRVGELATRIDGALSRALPDRVRVVGEISSLRDRTHWYFDLKDEAAVVHCVMFASARRKVGFSPRDGQEVVLTGRVEFYPPQGRVSLVVSRIEPVGVGALELAYRALCEELRALGWMSVERKRPLPTMPRRIAIVTSRSAAALADVVDTARRRWAGVELRLVDVRVQGRAAAGEIARAIGAVSARAQELGLDAVILTRGGGSMEDLWAFNERAVAEAIVGCSIPVVAAIGHETDTTIAELVADVRAATPTQAAMMLVPDEAALHEQVSSLTRRLAVAIGRRVAQRREQLDARARHPYLSDPGAPVRRARERLAADVRTLGLVVRERVRLARQRCERADRQLEAIGPGRLHAKRATRLALLTQRMDHAMRARLDVDCSALARQLERAWAGSMRAQHARLTGLDRTLDAIGPRAVLERGFSVTRASDGSVVRSAGQVSPGERLRTLVADGEIASVVQDKANRGARRGRAGPTRPTGPDQLDLFAGGG